MDRGCGEDGVVVVVVVVSGGLDGTMGILFDQICSLCGHILTTSTKSS